MSKKKEMKMFEMKRKLVSAMSAGIAIVCLLCVGTAVRAGEQIDVSGVLNTGDSKQRRKAVRDIYQKAILSGTARPAMMAFAVMIYEKDAKLADAARKRVAKLSDSISDLKIKSVGLHALAVATDDNLSKELIPLINHHSGKIRHAALDAAREVRKPDAALLKAIEDRIAVESDPAIKPAVRGTLCRLNPGNKAAYVADLKKLAEKGDSLSRLPALIELVELGEKPRFEEYGDVKTAAGKGGKAIIDALCGREFEDNALIAMTMGKNHAVRLEAVEIIAKKGSPALHEWMRRTAKIPCVHARLMGAYYVYLRGDTADALKRLKTEDDPMTQVMLLGTLLKNGKEVAK